MAAFGREPEARELTQSSPTILSPIFVQILALGSWQFTIVFGVHNAQASSRQPVTVTLASLLRPQPIRLPLEALHRKLLIYVG